MTSEPSRLPRRERQVRHHEIDIERHAHPGEPRQPVTTDHETATREPLPRRADREERGGCRDRF
jgi:hypothetical protein